MLSLPPPFCVDFAKNSYDSLSLSLPSISCPLPSLVMCVFVSGNLFLIVYDFVCFFSHEINFISLLNFKFGPSKKFHHVPLMPFDLCLSTYTRHELTSCLAEHIPASFSLCPLGSLITQETGRDRDSLLTSITALIYSQIPYQSIHNSVKSDPILLCDLF